MAQGQIRVVLVVHRELVREGVRGLLTTYPSRIAVVGAPTTVDDVPDCDVAISELDGSPAGRRRLGDLDRIGVPIVGVSLDPAGRVGVRARRAAGVSAVVGLDSSAETLLAALEAAVEGRAPQSERKTNRSGFDGKAWGLTGREVDVLTLICRGFSNAELAQHLRLSENSVKGYVRLAYRKVGVKRRSQAVIWGLEHGLDTGPAPTA